MESIPVAVPMQCIGFTAFAYFRAMERDATRFHKVLAGLLSFCTIAMCITYVFFNAVRDPPPTIHPNDILAISFPPTHAAFANGTGVPAHWHVVCAWPDQWSSCAYADVDDYSAGVTSMPCHMRARKPSRDAVDIGSATVRCSVQWRVHNDSIVPHVVQGSCNVTIGSTYRPWIARDPTAADALLAEHAAALERAQIVGGRSVLPIAFCDVYSGAFLRHGQQAAERAVKPFVEAVDLLDRIARSFQMGMCDVMDIIRDAAHAVCLEIDSLHCLVARIANRVGMPMPERRTDDLYARFCASRAVRFETTYPVPSANCTYAEYPKFGEYANATAFSKYGMSLSFLIRTHGPHVFGFVLFFGITVSFCFVAPTIADIILHTIAFGFIWFVRCTTLPQATPLLHEAADALERFILPWSLLSRIRAIAYK